MWGPICPKINLKTFDLFIALHIFFHKLKVWDRICCAQQIWSHTYQMWKVLCMFCEPHKRVLVSGVCVGIIHPMHSLFCTHPTPLFSALCYGLRTGRKILAVNQFTRSRSNLETGRKSLIREFGWPSFLTTWPTSRDFSTQPSLAVTRDGPDVELAISTITRYRRRDCQNAG